jgi:DNA-binding NarL/FixJ family response regulator
VAESHGQMRAELDGISGRSPGPVVLTAAEQRVAELRASGWSNKDVAAELSVIVRAIESTLTQGVRQVQRPVTHRARRAHAQKPALPVVTRLQREIWGS